MKNLYRIVDEILSKVNFGLIWDGFEKTTYALYNNENVYFRDEVIPYDRRFLGNTSIDYNGESIAIWFVEDAESEDVDILASNLVHEMFHAFQRKNNEVRFSNDLELLIYPNAEENHVLRHTENLLLKNAFLNDNIEEKRKLLMQFISARNYREHQIGEIIKQEYLAETLEGMAEYAGLIALKQISNDKYNKIVDGHLKELSQIGEQFFSIRLMAYYSGAILCMTLSESEIDFYHQIGKTDTPLFGLVSDIGQMEKPVVNFDQSIIIKALAQYESKKKAKFEEFLSVHMHKIEGDFVICGYDPMNMIRMDDMILCDHFVMLKEEAADEPKFLQGPVTLVMEEGSLDKVRAYFF